MDTVHERDRQTDGRTDRITITDTVQRIASHGKNWSTFARVMRYNIACPVFLRHSVGTRCQIQRLAFWSGKMPRDPPVPARRNVWVVAAGAISLPRPASSIMDIITMNRLVRLTDGRRDGLTVCSR